MIDAKTLTLHRNQIIQEAKRVGITQIYACKPLAPTAGQCFLIELDATAKQEGIDSFRAWIKQQTGFKEEIILLNKQTVAELIDSQSQTQQVAYRAVLNSAILLSKINDRLTLEQQLDDQEKSKLETRTTSPISQALGKSLPFLQQTEATNTESHREKRQRIAQIQALVEQVENATAGTEEQTIINWTIEHVDLQKLLQATQTKQVEQLQQQRNVKVE